MVAARLVQAGVCYNPTSVAGLAVLVLTPDILAELAGDADEVVEGGDVEDEVLVPGDLLEPVVVSFVPHADRDDLDPCI